MTQQDGAHSQEVLQLIENVMDKLVQLETRLNRFQPTLTALGMTLNIGETIQQIRHLLDKIRIQTKNTTSSLEQLQVIVRTSALITSSLELEQVLKQVIDSIVTLTGAERVYLMLRDPQTGELVSRTARNWDRETIREDDVMISHKVVGLTVDQKQPILTTNAQQDTRFGDSESVIRYALRSILCVPLLIHDNTVGVLYADNRIVRGVFLESHVPLLAAIGTHAAVAIENARLFAQTRADLEEARRSLQEIQSKSVSTPPTPPAIETNSTPKPEDTASAPKADETKTADGPLQVSA